LLGIQVLAVVVAGAWAGVWTFIIAKIIDKTVGLKITTEEEEKGLDLVEHGEFGKFNM
jgi:Amt family ammonium transporter